MTASTQPQAGTAIDDILEAHAGLAGPLLPILHAVQERYGFVSAEHVPIIARRLNLSRAEVHGVVSFYHYFRHEAPGRHVLQVCRAEACQARGCERTEQRAKTALGVDHHGTSPDGTFTLEPVYCLGNCALGPSVMIGDTLYGRVTPERLDELLDEWRNKT